MKTKSLSPTFLALVSLFVFTGCATLEKASRPKEIQGEKCRLSPRLRVFQVLDDGILAHLCPIDYPSYYDNAFEACVLKGEVVYLPVRPRENNYVDEQKITLPDTKCFAENGTHSYLSNNNMRKTVRKIKILEEPKTPNTN